MNDAIKNPQHYTCHEHECIDEMIIVFGVRETISFCKLNAWKYRYRAGSKGSPEEDNAKADWYISKVMELQESLKDATVWDQLQP